MAEADNKRLFTKLADRGEQVVGRITELPGAKTLMDRTTALTKRLDEMQRRLRSLDVLEKRVASLERRLEKLEGKGSGAKRPATRRTTTAKAAPRRTTTRKRPPSSS
jgi:DNA anti-recombination protein RmuC